MSDRARLSRRASAVTAVMDALAGSGRLTAQDIARTVRHIYASGRIRARCVDEIVSYMDKNQLVRAEYDADGHATAVTGKEHVSSKQRRRESGPTGTRETGS